MERTMGKAISTQAIIAMAAGGFLLYLLLAKRMKTGYWGQLFPERWYPDWLDMERFYDTNTGKWFDWNKDTKEFEESEKQTGELPPDVKEIPW